LDQSVLQNHHYGKDFSIYAWQVLGKLSFGMYLFHIPVVFTVLYTQDRFAENFDRPYVIATILKTFCGTYVICLIYWLIVEKPVLSIEAHFNKKHDKTLPITLPEGKWKVYA